MVNEQQQQMLTALAQGLSTPPRTPILRTPKEYGMEYEEISFTTADGVKIQGWFIPANSDKVIISNHFSPANRYGFAGHMEGLDFAGGFEVNFLPRYKALHDAGYNVLAYDLRSHGESGDGEGKISGVGYYEWQEVLASIDYIKSREDTANQDISLMSMCMGANATINAMEKKPEAFKDIKSLIAIAPLKGKTTIERQSEQMGIPSDAAVAAFEPIYNSITGLTVEDHNIIPKAKNIQIPTYFLQVRNDTNSRWTDVQEIFDNTPVEDKKIEYVEETPWRFKGYTYFSEHPESMIEWFDNHMKEA
ncbi:MAG TPA: alpha/beta hydrolase [Cytophagales bacterium]|nr:alpha/beta hydrolase [Cytophagales bacterium]HAA20547.1 alpha/beta hydrolase [Cytophagales bacterium]HAP59020.1 alpha/beta hydrolase [Cytophagales bacterium]